MAIEKTRGVWKESLDGDVKCDGGLVKGPGLSIGDSDVSAQTGVSDPAMGYPKATRADASHGGKSLETTAGTAGPQTSPRVHGTGPARSKE